LIEAIDATIEAYLQQLDGHDTAETPLRTPTAEQMQQKLEPWPERQPRYQRDQQPLQQSGAKHISRTDPDRRKSTRGDSSLVGDHVPVAVDAQHKRSVEHDVTKAVTDPHQRVPMAERATQTVGAETRAGVADLGDDGAEVQQCDAQGLPVDLPNPPTSANTKLGLFGKERVTDHPEKAV
jgi:hypothetical protein